MTTTTASTLSPRASGLVAAIVAICDAARNVAVNDNAGLAWRVADGADYVCDDRRTVEVADRASAALAPAISAGLDPSWWAADVSIRGARSVRIRSRLAQSRATVRRTSTLVAMLRAAGIECD